ncbi:MAG: HAD family phosphatase [Bacteroidales bacterium]|nr:HAD family phosphatase [Bacteroidales bacterium]
MEIKNLILDMGGVILDVDYKKIFLEFVKYDCNDMQSFFTQQKQIPLVDDFEKGLITPAVFREEVRKLIGKNLEDRVLDDIWNSMVLGVRKEDVELIKVLRKKYDKVFLFSNTNEIHVEYVKAMFFGVMSYDVFDTLFDKVYFSNEIHLRKPDEESFEFVVEDAGVEKEATMFIDDTEKNILGAERVGLKTYLLDNNQTITQIFNKGII